MTAATVSRWARRFVFAGAVFLLAWALAALAGVPRRVEVALLLFGFVFHTVFGKGYSLVPAYFDRELALSRAPMVQFPLTVLGTVLLAVAGETGTPAWTGQAGAVLWFLGVLVFVGALLWTIRGDLSGAATGTGDVNAHRRALDRVANAFVPVALAYLLLGSYGLLAGQTGLPVLFDGSPARATHLLAAGTGAMFVFAVGFRLLPRFFVAKPPTAAPLLVLPPAVGGPALIATYLPAGPWFQLGALLESTAIVAFAIVLVVLYRQSERRRVGFLGVLAGAACGCLGVGLGLQFAYGGLDPGLGLAHARLNLAGFLGLTIVGVSYQFYPPAVGSFPGAGDRTALAVIASLLVGLVFGAAGLSFDISRLATLGELLALVGAGLHAWLLGGLFRQRANR
ncbi:hypothetical protein [Haloarchaeobius amylolyticus]|uniref:hypothetical protein n=1 Tax=Haloarchaeobius amylolyticus TaxID=1198296 RepID=UPI0022704021|nr:hypothetical protein [Haloarchaeobius amylolyticus]